MNISAGPRRLLWTWGMILVLHAMHAHAALTRYVTWGIRNVDGTYSKYCGNSWGCNPGYYAVPRSSSRDHYASYYWNKLGQWWYGDCVICPANHYCPGGYNIPTAGLQNIPAKAYNSTTNPLFCSNSTEIAFMKSTSTGRKVCMRNTCGPGYHA